MINFSHKIENFLVWKIKNSRNRIGNGNSKEMEKFWHFLLSYEQMDKLWLMVSRLSCTSRVGTCTRTRTFVLVYFCKLSSTRLFDDSLLSCVNLCKLCKSALLVPTFASCHVYRLQNRKGVQRTNSESLLFTVQFTRDMGCAVKVTHTT